MAEISAADIETYTNGRLEDDGPYGETARMLSAALTVARSYTMWHVSPVIEDHTFTMDGPDSRILLLPTQKLVALTSIEEDGDTVDTADVAISAGDGPDMRRRIALRKRDKSWWTGEYSGIEIEMTHGFTEVEAADWRQTIMSMVDQMSLVPVKAATGASAFGLSGQRIDDVDYRYAPYAALAAEVMFSVTHVLDNYRLPTVEFL